MDIEKVHCLFEQSGTFKNAFIKNNIHAEDYDIMNEFGQTDHIIDLFGEIDNAYDHKESVFDSFSQNDLIFAFFPCTRFEAKIPLAFRGELYQMRDYTDMQKLEYSMRLHKELHDLYDKICKLFVICIRGGGA